MSSNGEAVSTPPAGKRVGRGAALARRVWGSAPEELSRVPAELFHLVLGVTRAAWLFRGQRVGRRVLAPAPLVVDAEGEIVLGDRVRFEGVAVAGHIKVHPGATLRIGDEAVFNYGLSIEVIRSVEIGKRCIFGSFVRIADCDGVSPEPIVIEDDVWVAHGAVILPGVTIGAGSVVAAGAVVARSVPAGSMAVGNPARAMSLSVRAGASGR